MIPAVSFIGRQGSGKTTLLTKLIPVLLERGHRVGTVKHAPHEEGFDDPAKDSHRHREAGAEKTLVVGQAGCALFWNPLPGDPLEATIEEVFQGFDIVLVEGFKHGPFPKVEVYRPARGVNAEPLAGRIDVIAVITDARVALPDGVAVLSPHGLEEIADFLEKAFL